MSELACWAVWAKSGRDDGKRLSSWLPLYQHLDDTAGVAGLLVDHWVSPQAIASIARDFPDGMRGMRTVAVWLAGIHDIGKVSPAFAVQVPRLTEHMQACGLGLSQIVADDPARRAVGHALVGQLAVRDWLSGRWVFLAVGWLARLRR